MENPEHIWKIDKSAFSVTSLTDKQYDRDYWMSRTPEERFEAIELMRQINYGYDATSERLQGLLEVVNSGAVDFERQTVQEDQFVSLGPLAVVSGCHVISGRELLPKGTFAGNFSSLVVMRAILT